MSVMQAVLLLLLATCAWSAGDGEQTHHAVHPGSHNARATNTTRGGDGGELRTPQVHDRHGRDNASGALHHDNNKRATNTTGKLHDHQQGGGHRNESAIALDKLAHHAALRHDSKSALESRHGSVLRSDNFTALNKLAHRLNVTYHFDNGVTGAPEGKRAQPGPRSTTL
jgi:hypothetical protein